MPLTDPLSFTFPSPAEKGDLVVIVSTARKISEEELSPSVEWLKENGFQVEFAPHLFDQHHQFAGGDDTRSQSLQWAIDHPDATIIWCARGGYGTARILDQLDWSTFKARPKWITGYSDITALHGMLQSRGIASIHGTMPINVANNTKSSLDSLLDCWRGNPGDLQFGTHLLNNRGEASGTLVGGNLSVLYSTVGSPSQPPLKEAILFMEDLDEYLYHIDRMMLNLSRNGWWDKVKGILVGGMTDMNDNTVPFGETAEEIIARNVGRRIPVAFGFPAGHVNDNRAMTFGRRVSLSVNSQGSKLRYF